MVRKCTVCKKLYNKSESRSFHRFPRDIFQKNLWLERLSLVEIDVLGMKDALVCSDHFAPDDLVENISGRHVLKFKAVPKGVVFLESSSNVVVTPLREQNSAVDDSTDTTSKVSLRNKKRMYPQMRSNSSTHSSNSPELETQLPSVTRAVFLESSDVMLDKSPLREKNSTADDSTDTASKVSFSNKKRMYRQMSNSSAHSSSSSESETQLPSVTRRTFRMPRYMGDVHTSDMSNPLIAKAAWKIAKEVVRKQRKKLILLQRQNRRLRNKLVSLSSLLTHLTNNHYISSSAESVL